jgi:hypothetical protein
MSDETKHPPLAHPSRAPLTDNLNIQTAGPRGPALLQDVWFAGDYASALEASSRAQRLLWTLVSLEAGNITFTAPCLKPPPAIPRQKASRRGASTLSLRVTRNLSSGRRIARTISRTAPRWSVPSLLASRGETSMSCLDVYGHPIIAVGA